jgi:FkbM family methyltransferase
LIYDVGMHNGDDTAYYLRQGHRVVAIEADPDLAALARERFAEPIRNGQLAILNVGIAAADGVLPFWICEGLSEWNSFDRSVASRNGMRCHAIDVPTRRFAGILHEHGVPAYLKIDIEGSDVLCLQDIDPSSAPRFISIESECGNDDTAPSTDDTLGSLRLLAARGYRRFKLIDQRTYAPLTVPFNADLVADRIGQMVQQSTLAPFRVLRTLGGERMASRWRARDRVSRRDDWRFAPGSSGAWGEGTLGRWMTFAEAERAYRYFRRRHFQNPSARSYGFWCDWHAAQ